MFVLQLVKIAMNAKLVRDYLRGASAVSVLIVLPMLQVFSTRIAPAVLAVAGLICVGAVLLSKRPKTLVFSPKNLNRFDQAVFLFLSFSILWAVISLLWGLDPARGFVRIISITVAIWTSWFLATQFKKLPIGRLQVVYLIGIASSIVALYAGLWYVREINALQELQHQRYDYNRIAVGLSLLVWPLVFLPRKNVFYTALYLLLFIAAVSGIFSSESETAKLGLLCGLAAAIFSSFHSILHKAVFLSTAAFILIMPILIGSIEKTQSLILPKAFSEAGHTHHRLQIWKGASDLAFEKVWVGWGMKSDRVLAVSGAMGEHTERAGYSPENLGPHNLALELWVNVGLIGMLLISAVVVLLGFKAYRAKRHLFAFVGIQMTASVMSLAGSGATGIQGWLLAILAIASATCIALGASGPQHILEE